MSNPMAWRKGYNDGAEDVQNVLREQGIETVEGTLEPGHLGWDEGAAAAGAAELAGFKRDREVCAYYDGYATGGLTEARRVVYAAALAEYNDALRGTDDARRKAAIARMDYIAAITDA